ncbi:hypothetical protein WAE56_20950 [Iodobacter sp. LRB]|uniref:hypothetical protein n=1 Tax=unclassified Iodobacter TaxID=235634 RepID=UPI000C0C7CAB|nr:hypothetical protein [Iodobacter sp. BJB302]PHV00182.1 hypothetical protein CSQ88_18625 [Iodobacter sp. BJB302]
MKRKPIFMLTLLVCALSSGIVQAEDHRYKHSHSGSQQARNNSDVSFGNPADITYTDKRIRIEVRADGSLDNKNYNVFAHDSVRFELVNGLQDTIAFVVGDEASIYEFSRLYAANSGVAINDFHAVPVSPGKNQFFGWKFSTYSMSKVHAAYVQRDGTIIGGMVDIRIEPELNK